jgi:hypothetical protein
VTICSSLHRRFPTFSFSTFVLVGKRRNRLSASVVNNQAYFAATVFWKHSPVVSLGIADWEDQ